FFFQAEDGIRDRNVTGVQTCALPILEYEDRDTGLDFIPVIVIANGGLTGDTDGISDVEQVWDNQDNYNKLTSDDIDALQFQMFEIGRASCRERIEMLEVAVGVTTRTR